MNLRYLVFPKFFLWSLFLAAAGKTIGETVDIVPVVIAKIKYS